MVGIPMTDAKMGFFSFERTGNLTLNYTQNLSFPCGFSISRKPISGTAFKTKKVKQNCVFNLGKCGFRVVNVLSKGEPANLEKEFEFKPSFDEYLRTMESVRTKRESRQENNQNSYKSIGDLKGDGENVELREFEGQQRQKKSASFLNRNFDELARNDDGKDRGRRKSKGDEENVKFKEFEGQQRQKKFELLKKTDSYKNFSEPRSRVGGKDRGSGKSKDTHKIGFEEKSNAIAASSFGRDDMGRKERGRDLYVKRRLEVDTENERWMKNKRDSEFKGEKSSYERVAMRKKTEGNGRREEMERAAFKLLEESNDFLDKPRVSRMEMEERIQKLAKCLNGADIDMPEWVFSKMMRSAKIRFSDHSMVRVIQILGKLGNWRRVLQVIEWIQLRERFKSHKIRYIYTAALDVLGKARRPVEALNVFNAMLEHMSTYPDLVAYHCIAVTLGQAGHIKELFDVIDTMQSHPKKKFKPGVLEKWDPRLEPDMVVYNAVLNACVRRKQWEGAFWVLQQLKQQNIQPSSTTYGLVMEVMLACGKYDLVHEFFKKVQKSSIPNALTYKVLVNALWREGKTDEAILAVEDMERRGIIGSSGLYYDLARCLCSAGRCQEALMQIDKICKVANKPLVVTYTGLIQACLGSGNIQNGAYIFNHMQKSCSPNLVTCNVMLKAYVDNGMFEEAKSLFQKMSENGSRMSSKADYKERVIVIPDIYTFNTMLDVCLAEQRWDDLEYVYERMLHQGYHFNEKRHLSMVLDSCRAGKVDMLETTWKHLLQADRVPPPHLLKQMLCMKLEQDDYSAALSCVKSHGSGESSHGLSHKAWLNFFEKNGHRFRKTTLFRFVEEGGVLISRSDSPSPILHNLITSCREFLRINLGVSEDEQTEALISQQLTN